jgi:hypothetical protein
MTWRDGLGAIALIAGGVAGGLAVGPLAAVLLAVVGAAAALVVIRAGIRWVVAVPVVIGTAAGSVLGWAIAHAFCRPDGCPVIEVIAAIVTGVGSFVGVGLVVALSVRSFDEYRAGGPDRPVPPP